MKQFLFLLAALLSTNIIPAAAQTGINPGDGMPAMEVTLKNANGNPTSLKQAVKENGLLVMFSCNTCPYVIRNQPITRKVMEYAAVHHIGLVIINSNEGQRDDDDSYDAMVKYAGQQKYTVPYLVDEHSRLADLFGASHTPEVYLFNRQNKLVYKGAMNDNPSEPNGYKKMYVEDAMDAMIAGREIDPKTTRSIGCGIKRKA